MIKLQTVVNGLEKEGYKDVGGSGVFRILIGRTNNCVKVYYDNYEEPNHIIIREYYRGYSNE